FYRPNFMIHRLIPQIFSNRNERELNRLRPTVARINEIEGALQRESLAKLLELTASWRDHLSRYHPLDAPPKTTLERMAESELVTAAAAISARLAVLRSEFRSLPTEILASVESIEAAKAAFHQISGQ